MSRRCDVPPAGWICTRLRGHTGPCAAVPHRPPLLVLDTDQLRALADRIQTGVDRCLADALDQTARTRRVKAQRFLSTLEVDSGTIDQVRSAYERVIHDYETVSGKRARVVSIEVVEDFNLGGETT
jgi:hypothetical protein